MLEARGEIFKTPVAAPAQIELEDAIAAAPVKPAKANKPKPVEQEANMTAWTDGDLIAKYIELRDTLKKMDAEYQEQTKPYTEGMKGIEGLMAQRMLDQNVTQIKADGVGTAFRKRNISIKVADRQVFLNFVFENNGERFLTSHVNKEAAEEFMTAHAGALPPGVEATEILVTQFRKA